MLIKINLDKDNEKNGAFDDTRSDENLRGGACANMHCRRFTGAGMPEEMPTPESGRDTSAPEDPEEDEDAFTRELKKIMESLEAEGFGQDREENLVRLTPEVDEIVGEMIDDITTLVCLIGFVKGVARVGSCKTIPPECVYDWAEEVSDEAEKILDKWEDRIVFG